MNLLLIMPRKVSHPKIERRDLVDAWNRWRKFSKMVLKQNSISEYSKPIRLYLEHLEQNNLPLVPESNLAISAVVNQIRDFVITYQEKRQWKSKYCTIAASALKTFYNVALSISLRGVKIPFVVEEEKVLKDFLFSEEEVETILEEAEEKLDLTEATMIHLGYICCLRSSELVTVRKSDFIQEDGKTIAEIEVKKLRKEKKKKRIEIPKYLISWIEELASENERSKYLFLTRPKRSFKRIRKRRYLPGEWSNFFRQFVEIDLGIVKSKQKRAHYWHNFSRHTRLTLFVKKYKPTLPQVMLLSGHQEPKTCLKYFKLAGIETEELKEFERL